MNRIVTILLNLAIIGSLIGGVALYNYNTNRSKRYCIHTELMSRVMASPHAKEFKPVPWEEAAGTKGNLKSLDGQQVVFLGYGKPTNKDYIRDLGSVGTLGMDPCCPKPISYRHVTSLSLSPLPYHCYFWKEAPVTVDVALAAEKGVDFIADQPGFYRGTLRLRDGALSLEGAEKLDTAKGNIFGGGLPPAPAAS